MTLRVGHVLEAIDQRAPFDSAAAWDAVGLQIGDPDRSVSGVAVVHEFSPRTTEEVIASGVELVISYHPLLFRPLSSITAVPGPEGRAFALVEGRVAVIAAHTNWDAAPGGTSESLATALGLRATTGFASSEPGAGGPVWFGRCGLFDGSVGDLVALVEARLGARPRVAGRRDQAVTQVAVLPGSGGSQVAEALAAGADAYVTGDVSHHQARRAAESGMAVVDAGHGPTERPGVRALYALMADILDVPVQLVGSDDNPWE